MIGIQFEFLIDHNSFVRFFKRNFIIRLPCPFLNLKFVGWNLQFFEEAIILLWKLHLLWQRCHIVSFRINWGFFIDLFILPKSSSWATVETFWHPEPMMMMMIMMHLPQGCTSVVIRSSTSLLSSTGRLWHIGDNNQNRSGGNGNEAKPTKLNEEQ